MALFRKPAPHRWTYHKDGFVLTETELDDNSQRVLAEVKDSSGNVIGSSVYDREDGDDSSSAWLATKAAREVNAACPILATFLWSNEYEVERFVDGKWVAL